MAVLLLVAAAWSSDDAARQAGEEGCLAVLAAGIVLLALLYQNKRDGADQSKPFKR